MAFFPENISKKFITAVFVDSIGDGLWAPFTLIFFVYYKGFLITDVGLFLSLGSILALITTGLIVGVIVDRIGAFPAAALSLFIRAIAFLGYLLASHAAVIVFLVFLKSFGKRLFWASHSGLVVSVSDHARGQLHLFATLNSLRNIGMGIGAVIVTSGTSLAWFLGSSLYVMMVLAKALIFFVAAWCLWQLRAIERKSHRSAETAGKSSYRHILSDYPFLIYTGATTVLALASISFAAILPIFLLEKSAMPLWMPGAIYLTSCIAIPLFQPLALWLNERVGAFHLLIITCCSFIVFFLGLLLSSYLSGLIKIIFIFFVTIIFSFGEAILGAVMTMIVLHYSGPALRGSYTAFFQLSWGVSSAIGPALFTTMFNFSAVFLWLIMVAMLMFVIAIFIYLNKITNIRTS